MVAECRTMIVEDDPDMALLTATMIEVANDGLVVACVASSGAEALRDLAGCDPHVIVLDYRMPNRNGLQVAADILDIEPSRHIVLFSAYLDETTIAEAERVGVRECVSKDLVKELPAILRKYCPAA
jgi:CheY-like chemotaxis protein